MVAIAKTWKDCNTLRKRVQALSCDLDKKRALRHTLVDMLAKVDGATLEDLREEFTILKDQNVLVAVHEGMDVTRPAVSPEKVVPLCLVH